MAGFKTIAVGVAVAALLAGGGVLVSMEDAETSVSTKVLENIEPAAADAEAEPAVEEMVIASSAPPELSDGEIKAALTERSLGADDAKITIREHSSFTCGHCGNFHKGTYKELKKAYIDTGKVRLVFSDFPLNGPALQASMVARCLDSDRYFDFVQLLFESQEQWAYSADYKTFLQQNAQLVGLSSDKFEACFSSEALRAGLLENMKKTQEEFKISSTPSFVINGEETISGGRNFEAFSKIIDKHLGEAE